MSVDKKLSERMRGRNLFAADFADEVAALEQRVEALEGALRKIAYEPFGPSDASHAQVLDAVTDCARAALAGQPEAGPTPDAVKGLVEALENFRTWHADHFGDFDATANAQLLCLDNDARAALAALNGEK